MRHWWLLAGVIVGAAGCEAVLGADFSERTLAPPTTTGSGGSGGDVGPSTTSSGSGGGGAGPCTDDAGCSDGDPCTIDTCSDGSCGSEAVPVGEPGTGESPCDGTCQTDGACGLSLYARAWPDVESDFSRTPLSLAWTGTDAPPPRGILAADRAYAVKLLVVFTAEAGGTVHTQIGDVWTKAPTAVAYPGLDGAAVNSAVFYREALTTPHTLLVTTKGSSPDEKLAYFFEVTDEAVVTPSVDNPYPIAVDDDPEAAPQDVTDCDWELPVQNGYVGNTNWLVAWRSFAGNVYTFDGGTFAWASYGPDVTSPIWEGASVAPAAGTTVAAYRADGAVYLVAP